MGCIYQLFDFTVIDCHITSSTHSLHLSHCNDIHSPTCTHCQTRDCSTEIQTLSSQCLHCQFFSCSDCSSSSITPPIPAFLSLLPAFHFYWLQPRNPLYSPFCIFHFFEEEQSSIHPFIESLVSMKDCVHCKHLKLLVFAYIPECLKDNESIQWLLSHLPSEKVITIPYSRKVPDLLKYFSNSFSY